MQQRPDVLSRGVVDAVDQHRPSVAARLRNLWRATDPYFPLTPRLRLGRSVVIEKKARS